MARLAISSWNSGMGIALCHFQNARPGLPEVDGEGVVGSRGKDVWFLPGEVDCTNDRGFVLKQTER